MQHPVFAVYSLQGPLAIKNSSWWMHTSVVEYFHLLAYAEFLSDWVLRCEKFWNVQIFLCALQCGNHLLGFIATCLPDCTCTWTSHLPDLVQDMFLMFQFLFLLYLVLWFPCLWMKSQLVESYLCYSVTLTASVMNICLYYSQQIVYFQGPLFGAMIKDMH